MIPRAMHVAGPADRMVAATRLARLALASAARAVRAATGAAMARPRPMGISGYWPNPSSTEGGRPWPPAPPHW
jgi:hypothetical protein